MAEAPDADRAPASARSPEALRALAERYAACLAGPATAAPAMSASRRRSAEHHDASAGGRRPDRGELGAALDAFAATGSAPGLVAAARGGARQRVGLRLPRPGLAVDRAWGAGCSPAEPAFRRGARALRRRHRARDGRLVAARGAARDEAIRASSEIDVVQPALFAIQVALAALWRAWGIEPDAVVGHSMGEVAAAHVAGALDLDGRGARDLPRAAALLRRVSGQGAMALVELSLAEAAASDCAAARTGCRSRYATAAIDGRRGRSRGARGLLARARAARESSAAAVKVDVASHSPQVDPLRDDLLRGLAGIAPPRPGDPDVLDGHRRARRRRASSTRDYWMRNLREPVLFAAAIERLIEDGADAFVEISPHPDPAARDRAGASPTAAGAVLPSMRREEPSGRRCWSRSARSSARLSVDWARLW